MVNQLTDEMKTQIAERGDHDLRLNELVVIVDRRFAESQQSLADTKTATQEMTHEDQQHFARTFDSHRAIVHGCGCSPAGISIGPSADSASRNGYGSEYAEIMGCGERPFAPA